MKPAPRPDHRANRAADSPRPKVGVSACLLGHNVRYDGGDKRSRLVADSLARRFDFVPVCPEVELGLGVPREPINLVRRGRETRLVGANSGRDHTRAMRAYARRRLETLARESLAGYIFKSGSPSCGLTDVEVPAPGEGRGLFADAMVRSYSELPVAEETSLADPEIRRNFIQRATAYSRLNRFFASRWTARGLAAFHAANRARLIARSPEACRALDRIVARAAKIPRKALHQAYLSGFMRAFAPR
ncbi:MAG: DUF523 and DUF1722 domain-containing protein [Candidatus Binataceae bacterium]